MEKSLDPTVMEEQEAPAEETQEAPTDVEKADLKISLALGKKTMQEAGGLQALQKGMANTKDPAQVVSKFLVQLIMKIKDSLEKEGIELSPRIVLSANGWLVQMVDFIEVSLKLPTEFSEEVIGDVMETFKAMLQGQSRGEQQGAPPQQAAPAAPAPAGPTLGG